MKVVLQDGNKDCGVCSLLSIIRYYGGDVSKEYLRAITNTTKNGVSAYNLIEAAKALGFEAEGVCGDMSNIKINNLPCLAHIMVNKNYKHFVVIYDINKETEKIIIMDPAKGKRIISFAEFKLMTTNNYIFLRPMKKLPFLIKKKVIKKIVIEELCNNKKLIILLIVLMFSYFILNILVAFHFKYLLEFVVEYRVSVNLKIISFTIFILYILRLLNGLLKNVLFVKISNILDETITKKTFKQILLLPYLYYKNRTTGEVVTRLKDLNNIKAFLINLFNVLVTDIFSFILFLVLMFRINKKITILIFIIVSFLAVFILIRNKKKKKIYSSLCLREEMVNSYLIESLNNVDTIKGGHIEKRLNDKFLLKYRDLLEKSYGYVLFLEISQFVKDNIKDILLLIVYGMGCMLVIEGKLDIGDIILFQSFLMYFIGSSLSIINVVDEYFNYKVSLNRVEDLYTISRDNFKGSYYYYNYKLDGDIVFNNLSYKYGSKMILDGVYLMIKRGEKVLLIGESGTGKSSLMKILMRYLDVSYGMCSIAGIDINHYHLENIRKNISYVSSNEFLFTDTLYNNVTLGQEIDEETFLEVANICNVDEIIAKRETNYHMLVEENGFNFSNGERQRIILFRYLLRKSNIYIFDEAFFQIDVEMERNILKQLFLYLREKTVIVISHRFDNNDLYDRIIKLENGKVHEEKV